MGERILVVAAHPDDEVIGAGGAMAKYASRGVEVHLAVMTDGAGLRGIKKDRHARVGPEIAVESESGFNAPAWRNCHKAATVLDVKSVVIGEYQDSVFDQVGILELAKFVEAQVDRVRPTIVFTHFTGDLSVDHRLTGEAVIAACRPMPGRTVKELYFFEVASSTEWHLLERPFVPNFFVDITGYVEKKEQALNCYSTEMRPFPHPRSIQGISFLNFWRGASVGVDSAEAFMVGRIIA